MPERVEGMVPFRELNQNYVEHTQTDGKTELVLRLL